MRTKPKTVLILLATLAIGVVIGALVVGPMIARRHFRHVDALRTREGMIARMEETIQPDQTQAGQVREILTRYAGLFEGINAEYGESMKALVDSMRQDLDSLLTDEQMARLERARPKGPRPSRHGIRPPKPEGGEPQERESGPSPR